MKPEDVQRLIDTVFYGGCMFALGLLVGMTLIVIQNATK